MTWYGQDPTWVLPLRRDARRHYGGDIEEQLRPGVLRYTFANLDVPGRAEPVAVTVEFFKDPSYETYGLAPEDYPRVFADRDLPSPHRMPDQSLCLYYPGDPPERRWRSEDGLLALLDLVRNHIFKETFWRATGAYAGGEWIGDEAAHGYQGSTP